MDVEAFILITVAPGNEEQALKKLNTHPIVKEAHRIVGPFDIVTRVEADTVGNLREFMKNKIHGMDEVRGARALLVP
jgi:DNA-binding Lrp family transcriptional regulator